MKRIALASALLLSACTAQAQQDYGPPSEVQKIYDIADAPSAARIQSDIQTLVDFGTRHTLSETQSDTRGAENAASPNPPKSSPSSPFNAGQPTRTAMS